MTEQEKRLQERAVRFARKNKKPIALRLTDLEIYPAEESPVSVFMAGSPGAGKTEASIELLDMFPDVSIIRIDPDEIRSEFTDYVGGNAWLFQGAVSILVGRVLDRVHKYKQSFLLDGTLSHYGVARRNIERSLSKDRAVQVLYVYQQPMLAWKFVRDREAKEGRRIKRADFIGQYFSAREVVNRLKLEFGKDLRVDLLMKNNDNTSRWYKANVGRIDDHIKERFTAGELEQQLPDD